MPAALVAGGTAAVVSLLLLWSKRWHLEATADSDFSKPQRIHKGEVPRIGGLALLAGVLLGMGYGVWQQPGLDTAGVLPWWLAGLLPVAGVGLIEDLTQRLRPRVRLVWMFFGSMLWLLGTGYWLNRLGVPGIDVLMLWPVVGVTFSVFACIGAINAYNIIDGLNGLLAGVSGLSLTAIALVAAMTSDGLVTQIALCMLLAMTGWLPFNWPRGRLFAGDGGAYLTGFMVVTLLMALVMRNNEISPWFGLLAAALPVVETVYSMVRRFRRGLRAMEPDQAHLHQLLRHRLHWNRSRRLMHDRGLEGYQALRALRDTLRVRGALPTQAPNASASPLLWGLHGVAVLMGVWQYDNTPVLMGLTSVFAVAYVWLHRVLEAGLKRRGGEAGKRMG